MNHARVIGRYLRLEDVFVLQSSAVRLGGEPRWVCGEERKRIGKAYFLKQESIGWRSVQVSERDSVCMGER